MYRSLIKIIFLFITLFPLINSLSQNIGFAAAEVRYNIDKINTTTRTSFALNDGTIWDVGHFIIDMPGEDVIVIFSEVTNMAIVYINGIEKNITFAGTTYDSGIRTMDIVKYRVGHLSYINYIDTTNHLIQLEDSTYWYVHPDIRDEVKGWIDGERIILDDSKQFIVNLRLIEIAPVVQAEVTFE